MDHAEENSCCYCAHGGRRAVLGPYPTLQLSFAVEPDSELEAEILGADVAVEDEDPLATEDSAMGAFSRTIVSSVDGGVSM